LNVRSLQLISSIFTAIKSQEQETLAAWEKSAWAKKLDSKKRRAAMTDFDRFKLMIAKKQKSTIVAAKVAEMSK
jgi:large subunit ribosomal protein L14e